MTGRGAAQSRIGAGFVAREGGDHGVAAAAPEPAEAQRAVARAVEAEGEDLDAAIPLARRGRGGVAADLMPPGADALDLIDLDALAAPHAVDAARKAVDVGADGRARHGVDAGQEAGLTLESLLERSEVVTVGIDGGGLDDLFAIAVVGRERETRRWLLWVHAWAHDDVLQLRQEIAPRLLDFQSVGDLTICNEAMQPVMEAADIVERVAASGLLPEKESVGLDPAGVVELVDALVERNIRDGQYVAVRQGYALAPASWGGELKLKNGTLIHGEQPLLAWCVGNAKVEVRGGAVIVTKQSAGRAKIDPLVAGFNAMMLMSRNPSAARKKKPAIL